MMFLIECATSKSIRGSEMETIFQESYFHSRFLDLNPYWQWMTDDLNLNELLHSCRADGAWCHWLCLWGWECNLFDIIFGRLQVQVQGEFFRQSGWWWKFTEAAGTSKVGRMSLEHGYSGTLVQVCFFVRSAMLPGMRAPFRKLISPNTASHSSTSRIPMVSQKVPNPKLQPSWS